MDDFNILDYLDENLAGLYELVGEELFFKIAERYGGNHFYVPKKVFYIYRNYLIYCEYMKGASITSLAFKWKLTKSGVRYIIKEFMHKNR